MKVSPPDLRLLFALEVDFFPAPDSISPSLVPLLFCDVSPELVKRCSVSNRPPLPTGPKSLLNLSLLLFFSHRSMNYGGHKAEFHTSAPLSPLGFSSIPASRVRPSSLRLEFKISRHLTVVYFSRVSVLVFSNFFTVCIPGPISLAVRLNFHTSLAFSFSSPTGRNVLPYNLCLAKCAFTYH